MRNGLHRAVGLLAALIILGTACRETATQPAQSEMRLPAPRQESGISLEAAILARRSVREFAATPLTVEEIGQLAWAAQGITDPARGFRAAPSAGALYPLELYFVTPDGLYHYRPDGHTMDVLAKRDLRPELRAGALDQAPVGEAPLVVVVAAVFERTAGKYGDRAARYVYIEAGHVGQNILLQAVALGLGSVPMGAFEDEQVARVLSLPEDHQPVYVIAVGHKRSEH